jgi:hypothetical protein
MFDKDFGVGRLYVDDTFRIGESRGRNQLYHKIFLSLFIATVEGRRRLRILFHFFQ